MLTCPHCHQPFTLVAAAAAPTAAPVATPPAAGAAPTHWFCPIHQRSKIVPAGVSKKTGKPYGAFWTCTEQGCEQRPPRGFPVPGVPQPAPAAVPEPPATNEPPLPPPPTDLEELPF